MNENDRQFQIMTWLSTGSIVNALG